MIDQASELRRLIAQVDERPAPRFRTLAITSGKGGVGKTNIAVNLGLALAEAGSRVALLDADWGLSNADMLLGVHPERDLRHVLRGECEIEDILVEAAEGLALIPGASGVADLANMTTSERGRLVQALWRLDDSVDVVLLDTSPGISDPVIDLVAVADQILLVTTAEPTSLADAYASTKVIRQRRGEAPVGLVINMASGRTHAQDVAQGFASVTERFLGYKVPLRGYVCQDPCVQEAVLRQSPFLRRYPRSAAAGCLRLLAREVLSQADTPNSAPESRPVGLFGMIRGWKRRGA